MNIKGVDLMLKWFMNVSAVVVVILSIPFNYHFFKMFITGNHPDTTGFYAILIASPFLPVIAVANAILSWKMK
jgi:hypothetical protein